jgi:transposase
VYTDVGTCAEIRRRALADGLSKRAACREYDIRWDAPKKIPEYPGPPGYRLSAHGAAAEAGARPAPPRHPPDPRGRQGAPRKQRHTARRISGRLRGEHGYRGGPTVVKEAVAARRPRAAEAFVPRAHPPGEARVDFGQAGVVLEGQTATVALSVMALPDSDAVFACAFPRECTEAPLEGHARAFAPFGGVPRRISCDNLRIAVAKVAGGRGRKVTDALPRPRGHRLCEARSCRARRPHEEGHVEAIVGFARRNSLVPAPAAHGGLEPLNADPQRLCRGDLSRRLRGKPAPRAELRAEAQSPPPPREALVAARVGPGVSTRCHRSAPTPTGTPCRPSSPITARRPPPRWTPPASPAATARPRPTAGAGAASRCSATRCTTSRRRGASPGRRTSPPRPRGGAAGLLRRLAAAGGRGRRAGDPPAHQGPAAARMDRARGAGPRRGAGAGARGGRRGRRAADPGAPPRAGGRAVPPRRPPPPEGRHRADARPLGLRSPGGGGGAMEKAQATSTVPSKHHPGAPELPTRTAECEGVAARCAREDVGHPGPLPPLCGPELPGRERRAAARRPKAARPPAVAGPDGSDPAAAPPVNGPLAPEPMGRGAIERRADVPPVGGSGPGKAHPATAPAAGARPRQAGAAPPGDGAGRAPAGGPRGASAGPAAGPTAGARPAGAGRAGPHAGQPGGCGAAVRRRRRGVRAGGAIAATDLPLEEWAGLRGIERLTAATPGQRARRCTIPGAGQGSDRRGEARGRRRGATGPPPGGVATAHAEG